MAFSRKQITTPTFDFGMLLAIGVSALLVAITLLLAESWACGFVMLWLASINLFNAWRAWRCLPDPLPTKTGFSLRKLLIPRAVTTSVLTVAARVKLPRFSLRVLLLSVLVCAVVFSWLKVRDDQRKIERRNELQRRLAILASEHEEYVRRLEDRELELSSTDVVESLIIRSQVDQTDLEMKHIRSQLGQAASK